MRSPWRGRHTARARRRPGRRQWLQVLAIVIDVVGGTLTGAGSTRTAAVHTAPTCKLVIQTLLSAVFFVFRIIKGIIVIS